MRIALLVMSDVHSTAQAGFSRGSAAYDRGRPGYPDELVGWLRDVLGVKPGTCAVDLGAGTGKFTRVLERTGADVIAVEPVQAMRSRLAENQFRYTHTGKTAEVIVDRVLSVSFMAALPLPEQAQVTARIQDLIEQHPDLAGRTTISFPYLTRAYRCVRK